MRLTQIVAALRAGNLDKHAVEVDDQWTQGRTLFGGLQAALLVRAMRSHLAPDPELPLRSLQVVFVGPVMPGRVAIR